MLIERAGDRRGWGGCCPWHQTLIPWQRLRHALRSPRLDPEEAQVDRPAATRLARARAVATFMENAHGHGMEVLKRALRRFGERGHRISTAERLGRGYEWPSSISESHTRYERLVRRIGRLPGRLRRFARQSDGKGLAREQMLNICGGLRRILGAIERCGDFESESQRAEVAREVEEHRADVTPSPASGTPGSRPVCRPRRPRSRSILRRRRPRSARSASPS